MVRSGNCKESIVEQSPVRIPYTVFILNTRAMQIAQFLLQHNRNGFECSPNIIYVQFGWHLKNIELKFIYGWLFFSTILFRWFNFQFRKKVGPKRKSIFASNFEFPAKLWHRELTNVCSKNCFFNAVVCWSTKCMAHAKKENKMTGAACCFHYCCLFSTFGAIAKKSNGFVPR